MAKEKDDHFLETLRQKYKDGLPEYYDGTDELTYIGTPDRCFGAGATCTSHAEYIATAENGLICGFFTEDNPCEIGRLADGHDFALIDNRYIVDTWLSHWECEISTPVFDLHNIDDQELIHHWYGKPELWQRRAPLIERVTETD